MSNVTRLYTDHDQAARIVQELKDAGIDAEDIGIVASHPDADITQTEDPDVTEAAVTAGKGEAVGAALGGLAGLLVGLGLIAIPGLELVVAAGWLIAAITGAGAGAVAGSLTGALVGAGLSEEHAHQHVEDIKAGSVLITVRTHADNDLLVEHIMDRSIS